MKKNTKPRKDIYLLLLLLSSFIFIQPAIAQHRHERVDLSKIPVENIKNECKFFSGDSLTGFPLEATIEEGVKHLDIYIELKSFVYFKEVAFVKQKYNIKKLPLEIALESRTISNPTVLNAACNNVDFESGTFSGWIGNIGYNANSNASLTNTATGINTLGINSPETGCSFHTLMNTGTDPNGGFPAVDPGGGTYAVRLGGENINTNNYVPAGCTVTHPGGNPSYYSNGESLEQTFLVTNTNSLFTYNYAVVLERAPHTNGQQPYFRVEVLDNTGTSIPCLNYYVQGDSAGAYPPGFINVGGANGIEYLPWQKSSLNLLPYINTNVTVRFTAAGCIPGGHFGYGYVDCSCAPLEIIIPTFECQGGVDSLIAPPVSGSTYAWAGPGIISGTTSQIATANVSGTYSVTITNAAGCSYVLDTTLIFYPNPTITVTSPSICTGGTTTLTAHSTGAAGTLTYTWNPAAGLTFSVGDSTAALTPAASTVYTVTGTSVHGCTNTAVSNVTVNSSSPPTFSAPPVCAGFTTVFNNTTTGGSTFDWNFGDGTAADTSTLQNPSYTYAAAGNYAVTLTVTTSSGCISQGTQTVTVNPLPTATFSAPPVCLNNPTVFSSTITNGGTYNWDYGDATITPASATPSHTYATPNTFAVTLTVTTVNGCTVTATNTVLVNPLPVPAFSTTSVCQGSGTVFTNTSTLNAVCAWNFGGAGNPASAASNCTPTYTYSNAGIFPVTLTVTTTGGCSASVTGSATVNALPALSFTANHPCDGSAVNFTNTTANQAAFSTWHWDFGDGDTSNLASPPAYTYTAPGGFSAAGCYSVALTATATTGCVGEHDTIVYVHNNPFAYFNVFEACFGTASEFIDSSFIQNPPCLNDQIISWAYSFGDGQTGNYTNSNLPDTIKHLYASCGGYNISLTVTTNNGCTNTNTFTGDTVFCLPVVTAPPSFSICPNTATTAQTFTSTVTNGGPAYTIWFTDYPLTNTGMNINDTLGFDVFPSYTTLPKNMSCAPVSDMLYGIAASAYCLGNMDSLKISVFPTPYLLHMQNDSICANQIISIPSFTACPANSTIAWANSNTSIGLGASGTGNIGSFTGLNTSNTAFNSGQIDAIPTANSCIGNDSAFVITVKPLPAMAVSTPAPYCPGDMVTSPVPTFTFSPAAGVNYNWSATNNVNIGMPASGIGPNTPATYTAPANNSLVDQTGVITYSPSLNGCLGTTVTETITIKPTPFVSPLANQFYCPNNVVPQINFVCTPSGGTPIFSYSGLGGIGIVQTGSIPSFTATNGTSLPIVSTVSVNATLNSCQGPNTSFNITVYPDPVANFSYTPACDGLPIVFANESTVGGGLSVSSWQWVLDNNGIVFSTAQNPQYTVTPAGTHSVNLLVSTSSVPSCTAQTTQLITVYPNPTVDFTGDNLKGCPSLNTQFTASASVNPGTITGYSWSFGNGQSSSSQTPSSQVFPNGSATAPMYYNVSLMVTTDKGCTAMQTKNNYVEVYPKPIAGFAWNPKNTDITAPTIEFVNQAIGASTYSPALTYGQYGVEYYLGDTYLPDNASNYVYNNSFFNHSYNDPDLSDNYEYYTVTQWVINKYGCTDSIMERVEILPIVTFYIPNAFTPNNDGTDDGFKGTGIGIDNSTYNLWIFDRWGLMIYHAQDLEQVWDGHMRGHEGQPILQEDVYVWKVNFNDIFGKQHEYHGTVTLIK